MPGPIVVGLDGTAASMNAVDLAAEEAARRGCPLHIVHALLWPWITFRVPERPEPRDLEAITLLAQADHMVAVAVERKSLDEPGLTIFGEVTIGMPASVLTTASESAVMLVVGSRGLGAVDRVMQGSVASQLAARSACPVFVSRGRRSPSGNVLLVLDRPSPSTALMRVALEEAALRGCDLDAVHAGRKAYRRSGHRRRRGSARIDDASVVSDAYQSGKRRSVRVYEQFVAGAARHIMIEKTKHAQLVVVSQSRAPALSRSAKRTLIHRAGCPVLIVPDHDVTGTPIAGVDRPLGRYER